MWRSIYTLTYLVACSAGSSTRSSTENDPIAAPDADGPASLGARAERVLQADAPLNLELPDVADPPRRHAASEALDAACRAGHHRSCWYLLYVATSDGALETGFRGIIHRCKHGDFWSCRALPRTGRLRRVPKGLPGEHGRDTCLAYETQVTREACKQALMAECQQGFPYSCEVLSQISAEKERPELVARADELSRLGCTRGIVDDCLTENPEWPRHEQQAAAELLCKIQRSECRRLGAILEDEGRVDAARSEYERACQYGLNPHNCLALARSYLAGELREPAPGRAHKLVNVACAELAGVEREDEPECKSTIK